MLSYPDRHVVENHSSEMVGRREKQLPQQQANNEPNNGGSKFRRKLSHGLAFISNPLLQRKTTAVRRQSIGSSLAVVEPTTVEESTGTRKLDTSPTPVRNDTSFERSNGSVAKSTTCTDDLSPIKSIDPDVKPMLPRSRTLSFIPRPVRVESESSIAAIEGHVNSCVSIIPTSHMAHSTPSKIPTPSPPLLDPRRVSPRQYFHQHTSQQDKPIATTTPLSRIQNDSIAKVATRSRTTPNLMKAVKSPQPGAVMTTKQTGLKKPFTSLTPQKLVLQENVPATKRGSKRLSQTQDNTIRKKSLATPGSITNRTSVRSGAPYSQGKQSNKTTPPTARKRVSSHLAQQTPVTAKRVPLINQKTFQAPDQSQSANDNAVIQPCLLDSETSSKSNPLAVETVLQSPPEPITDTDTQRKTMGTPNGLGGIWRSSRALAIANHEVRRLPQSHTFHDFGRTRKTTPPVPPIPKQYQTPSLSNMSRPMYKSPDSPIRLPPATMKLDSSICAPIPEQTWTEQEKIDHTYAMSKDTGKISSGNRDSRPWSISEFHFPESADVVPFLQVKDYLPSLYWAGRFQSRFDQWRTEAMLAELNPSHHSTGPLSECKLNQEKLAASYIFAQLRDLCTTNQAADSLWEFEFKYRKDNKLLGNPFDIATMLPRKQDDHSFHVGAFGRAVRKLTPRKSSLVNLLKGRTWNKSEENPNTLLDQSSGSS
ncbi:hypothetical protein BKA66DRAFT_560342 [Pyrenochaeta sp. MPI-SDFR-AT-0127]|nr:hypothetical protein BKA66DRAFT_560342 [Pyrenochaeta sp. MPI-SDFR-AT-0127]